jgi:hypothetical protein
MKKIFLFSSIILILISCTQFEIMEEINPKITIIGDKIGLQYYLGDLFINDTWIDVPSSIIDYLKIHEKVAFGLKVSYDETEKYDVFFNYYLNGVLVAQNKNVVSADMLQAHANKIRNFLCIAHCDSPSNNISQDQEVKQVTPPVENKIVKPEPKEGLDKL